MERELKFDVVLYFEEVRKEHLHKYLLLNKELNKYCDSLLMIKHFSSDGVTSSGGGPNGIEEAYYMQYPDEYKHNTALATDNGVAQVLDQYSPKVAVFGCGKFVNSNIISFAKSRGIFTIQVSKVFGDLYDKGGDLACYINKLHLKCDTAQGFNIPDNRAFCNNFLFDRVGEGLPAQMSREQFCEKYGLNPDKEIFVYLPTAIQCVNADQKAQNVYRAVCEKVDNLIIKCHPNEYARWKADRVGFKWSYELYSNKKIPVLEQIDTHWCYEHVDCGISYQSGIGIEFGIYDTPLLYVHDGEMKSQGINGPWWESAYSWVGPRCSIEELDDVIENKKYQVEDKSLYQKHREKFLAYPDEHGYRVLTKKILESLYMGAIPDEMLRKFKEEDS